MSEVTPPLAYNCQQHWAQTIPYGEICTAKPFVYENSYLKPYREFINWDDLPRLLTVCRHIQILRLLLQILSHPQLKVTRFSDGKFLYALELGRAPTPKGTGTRKQLGRNPTAQQHTKSIQGKAGRPCWRKRYQRQAFEEEHVTGFHGFGTLELMQNPQCPSARVDLSSETTAAESSRGWQDFSACRGNRDI